MGIPVRRGYCSGVARASRAPGNRTALAGGPAVNRLPDPDRPGPRPATGPAAPIRGLGDNQHSARPEKGAAHSAVTAGDPNDRAVTSSNRPLRAGCRPDSSARPLTTVTRPESPRSGPPGRRNSVRRRLASKSVSSAPGHIAAEHQARDTSAGTQVEGGVGSSAQLALRHSAETDGMVDLFGHRHPPQEPEFGGPLEDREPPPRADLLRSARVVGRRWHGGSYGLRVRQAASA